MHNLDDLLAALLCGEDDRAEAAARQIPGQGEPGRIILENLFRSGDPDVRWWALRALAEFPNGQSTHMLMEGLQDPDRLVRHCAALGLAQQPSPQAVNLLIEAVQGDDEMLVRLACNALIAVGAAAVPKLVDILENGASRCRMEAARALAIIGDPGALPALYAAAQEDSALLQHWANEGLERMGAGMVLFRP